MKPVLIGVAGLSGSGKTVFARELAARLAPSQVITVDSYYHSQSHLSLDQRSGLNYDHPGALDWELLTAHLHALTQGSAIDQPDYLFDQHTRSSRTQRVHPQPFLILEGILALHRPEIRAMLDWKVFVATRPEECLRRRMHRDIAERGRTRESILQQYEQTVWPMALAYVIPTREFADLVVSGEEPLDRVVESAIRVIRPTLAARA